MGGVIVEHEMDVEIDRHGLLDLRQEVAEFDRTVTLVAAADDPAGGNVQGSEPTCPRRRCALSRSHRRGCVILRDLACKRG